MYKVKKGVNLNDLRKYGFKIGKEYPDNERCICNDFEREDFWLIPMNPNEPNEIYYADKNYDQPIWSIHVQSNADNRLWIECVPSYTYHISNFDMEEMFYQLYQMILNGIIEDDIMRGEKNGIISTSKKGS